MTSWEMPTKILTKNLCLRLALARGKVGLSQQEAAIELGVTQSAISAWENGRKMPTLLQVARMAAVYGLPMDMLVFGIKSIPVALFEPGAEPPCKDMGRTMHRYRELLCAMARTGAESDFAQLMD